MYVRACAAWRDFKILLEGYYYCERKKERKKLLAKNLQTVLYVAPGRLFRKFLDQQFFRQRYSNVKNEEGNYLQ